MTRRHADLVFAAIGAAAAAFLLTCGLVAFFNWNNGLPDVTAYWNAALRLRNGEPLYAAPPPGPSPKAYLYPPTFAALFAPLTLLAPLWGYAWWMALHFVFLGVLVFAATQVCGAAARRTRYVGLLALWILPAAAGDVEEGQVNLLIAMCIAVSLLLCERGEEILAGFVLALAVHVKLQPIVLLPVLLLQRRIRAAGSMVAATLGLLFLPALWLGGTDSPSVLSHQFDFVRAIVAPALQGGTVAGAEQFYILNGSFAGILHRLFGADVAFSPFPQLAHLRGPILFAVPRSVLFALAGTLGTSLIGLALWRTRRCATSAASRFAAAALVFTAVQMTSLTFWEHHAVSIALLLAPLVVWVEDDDHLRKALTAATVFCVAVWTGPYLLASLYAQQGAPVDPWWLRTSRAWGFPTVAILVLWGIVFRELGRRWEGAVSPTVRACSQRSQPQISQMAADERS